MLLVCECDDDYDEDDGCGLLLRAGGGGGVSTLLVYNQQSSSVLNREGWSCLSLSAGKDGSRAGANPPTTNRLGWNEI